MSRWPQPILPPLITVTPWSPESIGGVLTGAGNAINGYSNAAWPAAGLAIYVPFTVVVPTTFVQGLILAGVTVTNGNYDIGLYAADGTRLVSKGATAYSTLTANAVSGADLTDTTIGPGRYYMAFMLTSASDTMNRGSGAIGSVLVGAGVAQEDCSGAGALPATATFAQMAYAYLPSFGLSTRTLV